MEPEIQIILSGALTFGAPLGLAIRELVILRRNGRGFGRFQHEPSDPPPPLLPDGAPTPPRLPDCLIPQLPPCDGILRTSREHAPSRERVLEPA